MPIAYAQCNADTSTVLVPTYYEYEYENEYVPIHEGVMYVRPYGLTVCISRETAVSC